MVMAANESESDALGLVVRDISPDLRKRLGLDADVQGVLVTDVEPDSPAEKAGLLHGDIIMEVDREAVSDASEYEAIVSENATPGKTILVRHKRGNNPPNITVVKIPEEQK
jgi:serine protease Do